MILSTNPKLFLSAILYIPWQWHDIPVDQTMTYKGHSINCLHRRIMECLLWVFWRKWLCCNDGLMQERRNSIANALELRLSCINPSIRCSTVGAFFTSLSSVFPTRWSWWKTVNKTYRKVSNIRRTLVGNKIVDHSDVVGTSPVGVAPTTSSFST